MPVPVKRAIKRLVRGDDGQVGVVLIDIDTHLPVLDPTGYKILSVSDQPEPVASIATPNIPSVTQPPVAETPMPTRADFDRKASQTTPNVSPQANTPRRSLASTNPSATLNPVSSPRISPVTSSPVAPSQPQRVAPVGYVKTAQGSVLPELDYNKFAPTPGSDLVSSNPEIQKETKRGLGLANLAPHGLQTPDQANDPLEGVNDKARSAAEKMGAYNPDGTSRITSGYRDPVHNAKVGGTKASEHMNRNAFDFSLAGLSDEERAKKVELARLNEGVRIGAYSGNTGLHVDFGTAGVEANKEQARKYAPAGDAYPMFDTSIGNMPKAADWFTKGLTQNTFPTPTPNPRGKGFAATSTDDKGITKTNSIFDTISPRPEVPMARMDEDFSGATPAKMAASGKIGRTPEQIAAIARTFAGELGPDQLRALEANDPVAKREYANMLTSLENRANSRKYGTLEKALTPSQYNSLKNENLGVTDGNYRQFGPTLEKFTKDFLAGQLPPDDFGITSYYNPDISNPRWGSSMRDRVKTGQHAFGSLPEYGPSRGFVSERNRSVKADRLDKEKPAATRDHPNTNRDRQGPDSRPTKSDKEKDRSGKGIGSASREASKSSRESKGKDHSKGGRNAD